MTSETASKDCLGWAARDPSGVLSPYSFNRRAVGSDDVSITITHCGVCYADVIWTRNKHGDSKYPLVPGHEIVGIVKEVGHNVSRFKVGDHVGVGTYVNSCRDCTRLFILLPHSTELRPKNDEKGSYQSGNLPMHAKPIDIGSVDDGQKMNVPLQPPEKRASRGD